MPQPPAQAILAHRVAAEIRAEMARQRRTQADLASALGLSQTAVSRRLSGEVDLDVSELIAVARFLDVPAEAFLRAGAA